MTKRERRSEAAGWVQVDDTVEHRDADGERLLRVAGYAALFDTPSERMGSFVETLDARAFDDVMRGLPDVRFLEGHGGTPLARTTNGSLRLQVDSRGLAFEADLDARSQRARDLYYSIERGDVSQMSFGFQIGDEEDRGEDDNGARRVHVTRVAALYEVSSVSFPAYEPTSVEAGGERCARCGERDGDCRCSDDAAASGDDNLDRARHHLEVIQAARRRRLT